MSHAVRQIDEAFHKVWPKLEPQVSSAINFKMVKEFCEVVFGEGYVQGQSATLETVKASFQNHGISPTSEATPAKRPQEQGDKIK